ncbi:type II toxin-antitoxin system RelE/ParE family toxin [Aphanothece sacrum]|uniref:Addiction module protein n=1 Tax=Aphanothece sacrum FPU1 TaxID=1920663 RepID=A0A401ILV0_APHSA|nr:addiction module protein [Aphanothece sacrum FPU1]GBF87245.1 addiction module protein [Aphanothece sacrum FPU3]
MMDNPDITIITTETFEKWLSSIADIRSRRKIILRIQRLKVGNFGDYKSVGKEILELRIHHGPGYRVYFSKKGNVLVILLSGGDKDSQKTDIKKAQQIWQEIKDEIEKL